MLFSLILEELEPFLKAEKEFSPFFMGQAFRKSKSGLDFKKQVKL